MTGPHLDPDLMGAPAVLLLDVGQGDASLLVLPGTPRRAVLVDCNDAAVVLRHLESYGVERLKALVFTHLDLDHIRGGLELLRTWRDRTDTIYVDSDGRLLDESSPDFATAKVLLDAIIELEGRADHPGPVLLPPARGQVLAEGTGWRVRLVAPFHGRNLEEVRGARARTTNEHSAVVRVERDGGVAVLIGGDAPLAVWADLPGPERRADVFRIPHHGGALDDGRVPAGWSPERLYDEVQPAEAVISVGTGNRHDHPRPAWRAPLSARTGCRVRCTQVTPACDAALKEAEVARTLRLAVLGAARLAEPPWRHLTPSGRPNNALSHREVPCAGTVSVGLRAGGVEVRPRPDDHDRIIERWRHPWCRPPTTPTSPLPTDELLDLLLEP